MNSAQGNPSDLLFIGTHGHVTALRKSDGETVWSTSLPKSGYSVVAIVPEDGKLLCASGGHAFALDPATGKIVWSNGLQGLGHGITNVATMAGANNNAITTAAGQASANSAAASSGSSS